jgi:hypothetical protein
MAVAIPVTALLAERPRSSSLWELAEDLQSESRWIAQLADRLHCSDEADHQSAIADLEQSLAAEEHHREALHRKADATCWVIERLRGDAAYHQGQAKRFSALAKTETSRADSLESTLLAVLTRLEPKATSFRFTDHKLSSRLSDAIEIDNQAAIPPELITSTTSENPDKTSIKERIKAAIAQAINGLSKEEAAPIAFSLAATAVPGARLIKRRNWSIH